MGSCGGPAALSMSRCHPGVWARSLGRSAAPCAPPRLPLQHCAALTAIATIGGPGPRFTVATRTGATA
eukprot:11191421-Lingulodinium_polyedra.AAC.1